MNLSKRALTAATFVAALSIGCPKATTPGSDDGGPDASSGGGGTDSGSGADAGGLGFDAFCAAFARGHCAALLACQQADPAALADCIAWAKLETCGDVAPSVRKGYTTLNAGAAAQCLAALGTDGGDCRDEPFGEMLACAPSALFGPASAPGQGCFRDQDCATPWNACVGSGCDWRCQDAGYLGGPCALGGCIDTWCDGTTGRCAPPRDAGEACTTDIQCGAPGVAYCNPSVGLCMELPTDGFPCDSQRGCASSAWCDYSGTLPVCRLLLGVGAACTLPVFNAQCQLALFCDPSGASPSCQPRQPLNGACAVHDGCLDGLACLSGACQPLSGPGGPCPDYRDCRRPLSCDDTLRQCFPGGRLADAGMPCTNSTLFCSPGSACVGATLNADGGAGQVGTCVALGAGDTCLPGALYRQCPEGMYCNPTGAQSGVCQLGTDGGPCSVDIDCPAGEYCGGYFPRACTPIAAHGQPCDPAYDPTSCTTPDVCVPSGAGGSCRTPLPAGARCDLGGGFGPQLDECLTPYLCVPGADGGGVCGQVGHVGEACGPVNGLLCLDGTCQFDGGGFYCGPYTATCFFNSDCPSGLCLPDGTCGNCP